MTHSVNTYNASYTFPPVHPRTTPQQTVCEVMLLKSVTKLGSVQNIISISITN